MQPRISLVNNFKINVIQFSSIIHIGDSFILKPRVKVLAIQREVPIFLEGEGDMEYYSIYTRPLPSISIRENVKMTVYNKSPFIKVNTIKNMAAGVSGIIHIGSTNYIDAEAREKHIRQLLRGKLPV